MKKHGLILASILAGALSFSAPSLAQESGHQVRHSYSQRVGADGSPYHQDRLPDGTLTGPLSSDNPNG